jgi:hypothetical protein
VPVKFVSSSICDEPGCDKTTLAKPEIFLDARQPYFHAGSSFAFSTARCPMQAQLYLK